LELGRRSDGSFSLRLRRQGIDDPGVCTLYRSRPFRTAQRFVVEIRHRVAEAFVEHVDRELTRADVLTMVAELIDFDQRLARETLVLLANEKWEEPVDERRGVLN
jgi:hypothetical protein